MPSPSRVSGRTVTALLADAGVITEAQVQAALAHQRQTGRRCGEIMVELGYISDEELGWALAHQLGIPLVNVDPDGLDHELVKSFPDGLLHRLEAVPLIRAERGLSVAVSDPTNESIIDELERVARCPVQVSVATRETIRTALTDILGPPHDAHVAPAASPGHQFDVRWDRSGASFLSFHLSAALAAHASEIQFWPFPGELRVHHRIGSRLVTTASESPETMYGLLSRLSALGGPAIDDRDHHVTGRVVCPHGERQVLLDVSLLNHDLGIAVTLRVRPLGDRAQSLDDLGFDPIDLSRIRAALDLRSGIALVTGPARSGCSTTLDCLSAAVESDERRTIAFGARLGPTLSIDQRVRLAPGAPRAWQEIITAQNADVVVLSDVLLGERINEVLCNAGSGRLMLVNSDWADTFGLLEYLMARPHLRPALASRLRFVVQQRVAHLGSGPGATAKTPPRKRALFEVLHVTEPMRRLLRRGGSGRALRAMAEADGWQPLAEAVRALQDSADIGPREAARLLT